MPTRPAAPFVIRFGALGDMVLLTPLLRLLHRRFGRPCTVVGSGNWLEPLYAAHPDVARTLRVASRRRPYWLDPSQRRLVAALRADPAAPVYVCDDYAIDKLRWLLHRARVPARRCVYANPDRMLREGEHWIDRWQRFGAMTPMAFAAAPPAAAADEDAPCLVVADADRADLAAWLRTRHLDDAPLVLLQPGNKRTLKRGRAGQAGDDKRWPRDRWVGLIRELLSDAAGYRIVLCGAPPEAPLLRAIAAAAGSDRVLAAGDELPLRRLMALCGRAAAMIAVDTGPAQVAAALGCPLVVLYGAQPPSLWRPRSPTGSAVATLGGPPARSRVEEIPLGEVIDAWRALPLHVRSATIPHGGAAPRPRHPRARRVSVP